MSIKRKSNCRRTLVEDLAAVLPDVVVVLDVGVQGDDLLLIAGRIGRFADQFVELVDLLQHIGRDCGVG